MKGKQMLYLSNRYGTFCVGGNKRRTVYVVEGKVVTRSIWERKTGWSGRKPANAGPIRPARSRKARKAAIIRARKPRACFHDDWEILTHGDGGCSEFPEPTWYSRRCTQCGREEAEPDSGWYEPDESWRDYQL